ncbi:MAG: hypothetical protein KAI71_02190, partial [Candidatus Pacebacteria bacterium]|nr:hypothetical protein [Candidatus Paceibacterota bacterium]
ENSKFENLKNMEATRCNYEDMDKFEDLFLDILEKEGYTIEKLKEIAQDNPEKVILIMSEVINENLEYDDEEWEKMENRDWDEEDRKTPYEALSGNEAICYSYTEVFISAKQILEEKGIPHFDKFVVFDDGANNHAWNEIVTAYDDLKVSHIDLTDADANSSKLTKEKLNADSKEFNSKYNETNEEETGYKEKTEHKTSFLEKIKNYKFICIQEDLKKILTQYDLKLHKREQEIEISEESELSQEDKEKAVSPLL